MHFTHPEFGDIQLRFALSDPVTKIDRTKVVMAHIFPAFPSPPKGGEPLPIPKAA